jgi:THO complex subunit 2
MNRVCDLQVEAYVNQLEPIVESMRYFTPLAFDMLTYTMLCRLAMERDKVGFGVVLA